MYYKGLIDDCVRGLTGYMLAGCGLKLDGWVMMIRHLVSLAVSQLTTENQIKKKEAAVRWRYMLLLPFTRIRSLEV